MALANRTPKDFAHTVFDALRKQASHPKIPTLETLFETMYFASLKTEESQPITLDIVY